MNYDTPEFLSSADTDGFSEPPRPFFAQPVTSVEDKFARLRLIRSRRVGPATYRRLMAEHGSAAAALSVLPDVAEEAGVKGYQICPEGVIRAEIKAAQKIGARLLCLGDAEYPAELAEVADAPPALWALGDRGLLTKPKVALVGTRNASSLAGRMARKLAQDLGAAGVVTVSGMARGVDTAVHQASLETGTIAVLGGGVDVIYPVENTVLGDAIAAQGLRLSEAPMGHQPQARDFPRRNRIISGLAPVLVVVEAALKSGSMITARAALDQGREVLAVPGHPLDTRTSGCNALLRDGATLVRSAEDILDILDTMTAPPEPAQSALPFEAPTATHTIPPDQIIALLAITPVAEDQLARDLGMELSAFSALVAPLELSGQISRAPGGLLSLAG
jgi:DNA processing protein